MAINARDKQYFIGLAVGFGLGMFVALVLAEDGNLAPGIKPGTGLWKGMKLGCLLLMGFGGAYQALARRRSPQSVGKEAGAAGEDGQGK